MESLFSLHVNTSTPFYLLYYPLFLSYIRPARAEIQRRRARSSRSGNTMHSGPKSKICLTYDFLVTKNNFQKTFMYLQIFFEKEKLFYF